MFSLTTFIQTIKDTWSTFMYPPKLATRVIRQPEELSKAISGMLADRNNPQADYTRFTVAAAADGSLIPHHQAIDIFSNYGIYPISQAHTTVVLGCDEQMNIEAHITDIRTETPCDGIYCAQENLANIQNRVFTMAGLDAPHTVQSSAIQGSIPIDNNTLPQEQISIIARDTILVEKLVSSDQDDDPNQQFSSIFTQQKLPRTDRSITNYDQWLDQLFNDDDSPQGQQIKTYLKDCHPQTPHNNFNYHLLCGENPERGQVFHPVKIIPQTGLSHNPESHETTMVISTYVLSQNMFIDGELSFVRTCSEERQIEQVDIDDAEQLRKLSEKLQAATLSWTAHNEARQVDPVLRF